jgi:hypothetical protein
MDPVSLGRFGTGTGTGILLFSVILYLPQIIAHVKT